MLQQLSVPHTKTLLDGNGAAGGWDRILTDFLDHARRVPYMLRIERQQLREEEVCIKLHP